MRSRIRASSILNVGCGMRSVKGAVTLDYYWYPGVDLVWDARKKLPFPDGRFEGVFAEHFLEHIEFERVKEMLVEFRRVLKPGGVIRIVVPDGGLFLDLYHRTTQGEKIQFPGMKEDEDLAPMMVVNQVFRGWGHKYCYDFQTLARLLTDAGFQDVRKESYGRGRIKALLVDLEERTCESLYVEACAPGETQMPQRWGEGVGPTLGPENLGL